MSGTGGRGGAALREGRLGAQEGGRMRRAGKRCAG
ncbi:hypothetical protein SFR_4146 [Streptomyces sp. FR-008]|nr:hypothetical protein SFR_4146 [Streptomyces sp. FR-008]